MKVDEALQLLSDGIETAVKKAEKTLKTSYADVVRMFDSKITNAKTNPANQLQRPDTGLREIQDRQIKQCNLVIFGIE